MDETRLLVADDDRVEREGVIRLLRRGARRLFVRQVDNGHDAWRLLSEDKPHVFIGAAALRRGPGGAELCARIRHAPTLEYVSVALVAHEDEREAMKLALRQDADLVVTHRELPRTLPLKFPQLVERARDRRASRLRYRAILLCVRTQRAWLGGRPLDLGPALFDALGCLLSNPVGIHTYHAVSGSDSGVANDTARDRAKVRIWRLREKLGTEYSQMIEPVRGIGYRLHLERDEV